jgi:hypothetical protein
MAARGFGYVTAKAQERAAIKAAAKRAAYVSPLDGWTEFCRAQQARVSGKVTRSVRRVRRLQQRWIENNGTDVQFVESRKG